MSDEERKPLLASDPSNPQQLPIPAHLQPEINVVNSPPLWGAPGGITVQGGGRQPGQNPDGVSGSINEHPADFGQANDPEGFQYTMHGSRITIGRNSPRNLSPSASGNLPFLGNTPQAKSEEWKPDRTAIDFRGDRINNTASGPLPGVMDSTSSGPYRDPLIQRYRYYSRIGPANQPGHFIVPRNIIPPNIFVLGGGGRPGTQTSLITILSVWNTMLGTSILSLPWAIQKAGLGLALFLIGLMCALTFYTVSIVLRAGNNGRIGGREVEFADVIRIYLGETAYKVAALFSVLTIAGASVVYWVLMSNFLYNSVDYFHEPHVSNHNLLEGEESSTWQKWWTIKWTPVYLVAVLLPIVNFKSLDFFTKFNAMGVLSICYLTFFVLYLAYSGRYEKEGPIGGWHTSSADHIPWYSATFWALSGVMSMAFFIHNGCLSIVRNAKNPQNNVRDVGIAFVLSMLTYAIVGCSFYVSFTGDKNDIKPNFLDNFHKGQSSFIWSLIAQCFLLFQMITVFPLLSFIVRFQVMSSLFGDTYPSVWHVLVQNIALIGLCVTVAIEYPNVGAILRFTGAICGAALVFIMPVLVELIRLRREGKRTVFRLAFNGFVVAVALANIVGQFI